MIEVVLKVGFIEGTGMQGTADPVEVQQRWQVQGSDGKEEQTRDGCPSDSCGGA